MATILPSLIITMIVTIPSSGSLMMVMSGCRPTYYPDLSLATFLVTCLLSRSPHHHHHRRHLRISAGYRECSASKWWPFPLLQFLPLSFSWSSLTSSTSSFPLWASRETSLLVSSSDCYLDLTNSTNLQMLKRQCCLLWGSNLIII